MVTGSGPWGSMKNSYISDFGIFYGGGKNSVFGLESFYLWWVYFLVSKIKKAKAGIANESEINLLKVFEVTLT